MKRNGSVLLTAALLLGACAPHNTVSSPKPANKPAAAPSARAGPLEFVVVDPASVGMNADTLARVDAIITAAIADHVTPGAALAIGRHGKLVRLRGYGRLDYRPLFDAVTDSSLYDLASLTKVIGTTTAAMMLVQDGKLDLDAQVVHYLPAWYGAPRKELVTVRNLLLHNGGLPPFKAFWQTTRGRDGYLKAIGALPLDYTPGTKMVYSDLGLITVGFIVERITNRTIDSFLRDRLFKPLGLHETMYNPIGPPGQPNGKVTLLERIAPTEVDTFFRRRQVHGFVHDENAYAIGGVSGHAGLFSSARDLAVFAQMMLNRGSYNGRQIVSAEVIDQFRTRASEVSTRALGWDTPGSCSNDVSSGSYFSRNSIGHTGFTGTSIWMDYDRDVFVVLLTNRVNPTRDNPRISPLRAAVADAVQLAITDQQVKWRCQ